MTHLEYPLKTTTANVIKSPHIASIMQLESGNRMPVSEFLPEAHNDMRNENTAKIPPNSQALL